VGGGEYRLPVNRRLSNAILMWRGTQGGEIIILALRVTSIESEEYDIEC